MTDAGAPVPVAPFELGALPPVGVVPETMHAAVIRPERYGEPRDAMQLEVVEVPRLKPGFVLVLVMAAGVNYNNVWAGRGRPADVIAARGRRDPDAPNYHVGGTEGSGVVWAVGDGVSGVAVGDRVVLSACLWDETSPDVRLGRDAMFSSTQLAWGYEENHGTFAQFALAADYQCHPMPAGLSWAEAACIMATGPTAYRQLAGWPPNVVEPGDPVLVWGGSGGLGSMACQIASAMGGRPVAVVSDARREAECRRWGAVGVIDRSRFDHWGRIPEEPQDHERWRQGVRDFARAFHEALGERLAPTVVFEHPGRDTLPTSIHLCSSGGMIVSCGATSGYIGDVDLRYLWMRQKRLQGSHYANLRQCRSFISLVEQGHVTPPLGTVYAFADVARAHQAMADGDQGPGNHVVLVNATRADEVPA